jgi:hypothetical protein
MEKNMETDECFDGIILSGGGIRGIGELGVLHYYHEKGVLDMKKIKVLAATSIGSVISLLMICGYEPTEIFTKAYTLSNIIPVPGLAQIYEGIKNLGVMSIDPLMDIVKDMILIKMPNLKKIPTLSELYAITGKTLVVSVGNVTKTRGELLSHHNRPDLSVIDAVKMSCNLPILFKKIKSDGCYYIDGGFTNNFPSDAPEFSIAGCKKILGVAVLSTSFFGGDDSILSYPYNILLMSVMSSLNDKLKKIASRGEITLIRLNFKNASILEFGATSEKKMNMFMQGYNEAKIEDTKEYLMIEGWNEDPVRLEPSLATRLDGWDEDF